jgi:uncharacterized protein YPO0396
MLEQLSNSNVNLDITKKMKKAKQTKANTSKAFIEKVFIKLANARKELPTAKQVWDKIHSTWDQFDNDINDMTDWLEEDAHIEWVTNSSKLRKMHRRRFENIISELGKKQI